MIDKSSIIQSSDDFKSLVIKINHRSIMTFLARSTCSNLISSNIGSKNGIHVTMDKAYGCYKKLNLLRPIVLRQYFALDAVGKDSNHGCVHRYTYGTGSGSVPLGNDPNNFKTRNFTSEMHRIFRPGNIFRKLNKPLAGMRW